MTITEPISATERLANKAWVSCVYHPFSNGTAWAAGDYDLRISDACDMKSISLEDRIALMREATEAMLGQGLKLHKWSIDEAMAFIERNKGWGVLWFKQA
jgi:hypothetical protein